MRKTIHDTQYTIRENGYIAITTTLIVSLVMLGLAVSLGSTTLLTRFGTVDFFNKRESNILARSCLEIARLELAKSASYAGNETRDVDDGRQCTIMAIEGSGSNKIIKARAVIQDATTNLKLTVDADTLVAVSLEEVVKF